MNEMDLLALPLPLAAASRVTTVTAANTRTLSRLRYESSRPFGPPRRADFVDYLHRDRPACQPDPEGSLGPVERAAIGAGLNRPADGTAALLTGAGHLDRRGG